MEASNVAAKKYHDETPKDERSQAKVTVAMEIASKNKTTSLKRQYAKHLDVANP
jgi:hypothetical protein